MDKFEEAMKRMEKMPEQEMKKTMAESKKKCICPKCPTYNDCAKKKNERMYCISGRSPNCINEENGCNCPSCPLTDELGLKNIYFCTRGTEKEQRGI